MPGSFHFIAWTLALPELWKKFSGTAEAELKGGGVEGRK
jgi:hypothetical protein